MPFEIIRQLTQAAGPTRRKTGPRRRLPARQLPRWSGKGHENHPRHAIVGLEPIRVQLELPEKGRIGYLQGHSFQNLNGPIYRFKTSNFIDLAGSVLLITFWARKQCKRRVWHDMYPNQKENYHETTMQNAPAHRAAGADIRRDADR
ncbi:MAG: hypothetical protein AAB403_14735 [Planctomycetota bacterium]